MVAHRNAVGLSLLCAIFICAIATQSASAASAVNTTMFTCAKDSGLKDFTDPHCDQRTNPGFGEYGHVLFEGQTFLAVSNEKTKNNTTESTPLVIKGTIFGVKSEITCQSTGGQGSATSEEPSAKQHQFRMQIATAAKSCTVNKPALGCKVKEPIEFKLSGEAVEGLGAGKNEMGVSFKPTEGETFAEIAVEGCFIAGTYKITGTAIGTGTPAPTEKHSGATLIFTNSMTKETLKLAGNAAEISGVKTLTNIVSGRPISFTTST